MRRTCEIIAEQTPWPGGNQVGILPFEFLSYDDIQIVPGHGSNEHRADINITTYLDKSKKFILKNPILPSNMDSVTGPEMAIVAARVGGLGVLHRNMSIEEMCKSVKKVKSAQGYTIYSAERMKVRPATSVEEADKLMASEKLGFVLVYGENDELLGIATPRDILAAKKYDFPISSVMTNHVITAPSEMNWEESVQRMREERVEKIILTTGEGKVAGVATLRNWKEAKENPDATTDDFGRLKLGISVGIDDPEEVLERALAGMKAGADIVFVDAANVDHEKAYATLDLLNQHRTEIPYIIPGNVTTPKAVFDLINRYQVDAVKVLVGPGSFCKTRTETGAGLPAFTSVIYCAAEAWKYDVPIIADGGIQYPGDVAKAIGAGANTVMVGGLLTGTDEAPGQIITDDKTGIRYKKGRGMSTAAAREDLNKWKKENNSKKANEEGVESRVPLKGPASVILRGLGGGLRGGMGYSGGPKDMDVDYFQHTVVFARQTSAGNNEGKPRV